jgi:hypothetical protein
MRPSRLLRWYPRAWRERYGEELLALIQDTVDEGRPTWRLRLGVIWGGLRERGRQARHPSRQRLALGSRWLTIFLAGSVLANLPLEFKTQPPPARAWQSTAALDALTAVAAFTCAVVLAGGLAALPAVVRFLRAGGWPKIRRQVAWAAGATVPAAGGLAYLVLASGSRFAAQLNVSLAYLLVLGATTVTLVVAIGLWAAAVAATARHLKLSPRVRAAELIVGAVTWIAIGVAIPVQTFWTSATQASVLWLVIGLGVLVAVSTTAPRSIGRAIRKGRRLRAAADGRTAINPSAQRTHGRHRA